MTELELLEKLEDSCLLHACSLSQMFVGKVYEFLGQAEHFANPIDVSCQKADILEIFCEDGVDSFNNPFCGADRGPCGFQISIDRISVEVLEEGSEICDEMVVNSPIFKNGIAFYQFLKAYAESVVSAKDKGMEHLVFDKGGLWDILVSWYSNYLGRILNYYERDELDDLLYCIVYGMLDIKLCSGYTEQTVCEVRNAALDKWLAFLDVDRVSDFDRLMSKRVLSKLLERGILSSGLSTEARFSSYSADSTALYERNSNAEDKGRLFQMLLYQMNDAAYAGWCIVDPFQMGILSAGFIAKMLMVTAFLEEMEEKYHFLSWEEETYAKAS